MVNGVCTPGGGDTAIFSLLLLAEAIRNGMGHRRESGRVFEKNASLSEFEIFDV